MYKKIRGIHSEVVLFLRMLPSLFEVLKLLIIEVSSFPSRSAIDFMFFFTVEYKFPCPYDS